MKVQTLIELLQQFPPDTEVKEGDYGGERDFDYEGILVMLNPTRLVIPDYTWEREDAMRIGEYWTWIKEQGNDD